MITRLFLFMLAMVSGVSAAQGSSSVRAGEPAVGVASTLVADSVDAASACFKVADILRYPVEKVTDIATSVNSRLFEQSPQIFPLLRTLKSDRLRQ
jgi:hypothetical protein